MYSFRSVCRRTRNRLRCSVSGRQRIAFQRTCTRCSSSRICSLCFISCAYPRAAMATTSFVKSKPAGIEPAHPWLPIALPLRRIRSAARFAMQSTEESRPFSAESLAGRGFLRCRRTRRQHFGRLPSGTHQASSSFRFGHNPSPPSCAGKRRMLIRWRQFFCEHA